MWEGWGGIEPPCKLTADSAAALGIVLILAAPRPGAHQYSLTRCFSCCSSAPREATPMACTRSAKAGSASMGTWPAEEGRQGKTLMGTSQIGRH